MAELEKKETVEKNDKEVKANENKTKKVVKKKEVDPNQVQSYEQTGGIKEYKFVLTLLAVIAGFTLFLPLVFKGFEKLDDMDLIGSLFSKNEDKEEPVKKPNEKEKLEIVNADKSGANAPVLKIGMIPVRYNYIEKKWVKADSNNPSTNSWYNYTNKEWANAVLVKENGIKTREYYMNANADVEINGNDILAFFVWIPRYKYSMVSNTGLQQIDVVFEEKNASKSTGPNYITHPAFTFNGEELSGIWVGKFETTGNINNISVLPYASPIVSQNISTMINSIQGLYGLNYGLDNASTNVRLMKNTEWGAVTYLTNSKYGICKNNKCNIMKSYIYNYSTDDGMLASTTGNITGIYQMNDGIMEYVMGNNNGVVGLSGLDNVWMSENKKYYDSYVDGNVTDYTRGIKGDATSELAPFNDNKSNWNSSFSAFIDSNNPWFIRDIGGSIYSFSNYTGGAHYQVGFRISLS